MILVTGGAGFIGSVLIKELNDQGMTDIIVVDRLKSSVKWKNLNGLKFYQYIHADDLFLEKNSNILAKVKEIYHMGACSSTTEMDMDFLMKNNVEYSQQLFVYATEKDIPIIYASSAATYGSGEKGYSDNHEEIGNLRPLNPYGYSKQLFDEWVLKQQHHPTRWFGIKFFNVYGPNEYHKGHMRSIVHKAYGQIKESGVVKLFKSHRDDFEDGKQLRDFIYVKDAVKALVQMMNTTGSGIYNLGTGKARSFDDLVKATFDSLKLETKIKYIDMPKEIRDQYQYFTEANMEKFKTLLPDYKFSTLEEGVQDYVTNYLMQDHEYCN